MLYFWLFIVSGLAYSNNSITPIVFISFLIFFIKKYSEFRKKEIDRSTIMLIFMAYSLPFSWRNFMGGSYDAIPISWFYIFGMFYVLILLFMKNKIIYKRTMLLFVTSIIVTLISVIPIIYTNSSFLGQGITQFIILTFNNLVILFSVFKYNSIDDEEMNIIKNAYVTGALYTSIMLISQYLLFKYANYEFGYINFLYNRVLTYYLFTDISHGTLYLGTAAFWVLYGTKNKVGNLKEYIIILIISLGSAITSARTGLFILGAFVFLFIIFGQKNVVKKIGLSIVFLIISYFSFEFLQGVRQMDSLSDLTNSSGRTEGYKAAMIALKNHPFTGFGYSRDYLALTIRDTVPHLSILQYALHGGVFFSLFLYFNQFLIYVDSVRKKSVFSWLIMMVLAGTCLIPDLFATRYITLLCALSISYKKSYKNQ
ncbi:MAG: O-antigen ligase family protein [Vagococcus sp.]|uniref:O-antigen ligase family protein n=1 Tax=Vagococcus sp. TaxID=1933889 RepID=UPI002FC6D775